jgi:DNA-binding response OmpR family regulator
VIQAIQSERQVVVVDPRHSDYAHLWDSAKSSDLSLRLLTTGRAALRAARELNPDLWIINTELPDMDGTDLFEMLSDQLDHVPVVLVANSYCPTTEMQVRRVGAPIFACKPLDPAWLAFGVEHRHRHTGIGLSALGRDVRAAG